jgi:protein-arginine kinase activator protein McsA
MSTCNQVKSLVFKKDKKNMSIEYELREWDFCENCGKQISRQDWEQGQGYCAECWQIHNENFGKDIEYWLEMRREGLGYPGWIDDEFPEDSENKEDDLW